MDGFLISPHRLSIFLNFHSTYIHQKGLKKNCWLQKLIISISIYNVTALGMEGRGVKNCPKLYNIAWCYLSLRTPLSKFLVYSNDQNEVKRDINTFSDYYFRCCTWGGRSRWPSRHSGDNFTFTFFSKLDHFLLLKLPSTFVQRPSFLEI